MIICFLLLLFFFCVSDDRTTVALSDWICFVFFSSRSQLIDGGINSITRKKLTTHLVFFLFLSVSIYIRFIFLHVVKIYKMTSIIPAKTHAYSCVTNDLSFDETNASSRFNNNHSYETIPSPSRIDSHSPKSQQGILSSTLKSKVFLLLLSLLILCCSLSAKTKFDRSNMSLKHRLRYEKLLHHTRVFNRHYMITMTNILFHMHKQLYKLKRRTHRMEKIVTKQPPTTKPIIRISRLTQG